MSRSFLSRPVARRFIANSFILLYGSLAGFFAVCAWRFGWQSSGLVWCGLLAAFFGSIVYQEVRYCVTGVHVIHRQ